MLEVFETSPEKINKVVLILDKLEKVGLDEVSKELEELGLSVSTIGSIQKFLGDKGNTSFKYYEPFAEKNGQVKQGLEELNELISYLDFLEINNECVFNPFLARGLEIYTGTIYEIFLMDQIVKSSIGSGGRYDNAIGGLIGTNQKFSTVGISFGLDVIYTAVEKTMETSSVHSYLDYYVIPKNTLLESLLVANFFREKGYRVELELGNKKLRKALDKANMEKIRNVIIVGENEVKNNYFKIKDMFTGEEKKESFQFYK